MLFVVFCKRFSLLLFFIALFLSHPFSIEAQISASPTSGCAPLVGVQFNGISGSTGILWDFKDGTTASILNPIHTFSTPGIYTVAYAAIVAGTPVNQTISIKIFGRPTPSFVAITPTYGCVPLSVSFSDKSTGGGLSAIKKWEWAFGEGGVNKTSPTPTYTYSSAGTFNVSLKVTDANGCDSSLVIKDMITTSVPPKAVITTIPDPPSSCSAPFTVQFSGISSVSNSTTGSNELSYLWLFSDKTSSNDSVPFAKTYTKEGDYLITLTVKDNNNCSAKTTNNVSIKTPKASFSVEDTVCKTVDFTASNPDGAYLVWDYGDGESGTSSTHTYSSAGTYKVKLTVVLGNCSDDTIRTIVVEDVKAGFNFTPSYFCNLPGSVLFTNSSTNAKTSSWTFNFDPAITQFSIYPLSSTQKNPSVIIRNLDTNQYTINNEVLFLNAELTVTSPHGCISTISSTLMDTIFLPTARFVPDTTIGCAPLAIDFSDSSLSREQIVSWRYEFGDGTFANLNNGNTSHTYTTPGIYYPKLIIRNSKGCIDTSYSIAIYVGDPPVINFSVSQTSVCLGQPVQFNNLISSSDSVDTWHYSTDGGVFMSSCPDDPNPQWSYKNSTGKQDVTLTACWHGCCSSLTKSGLVNVKGPLVNASVRMNCDTPFTYIFTADVQDADRWVMDFGDKDSVTTTFQKTFSHTYSASGDYKAVLTAYNSSTGCTPSKDTILIKVKEIKANATSDTIMCFKQPVSFNASSSQDVEPKCNGGYIWIFGDESGPKITDNSKVTHSYLKSGTYKANLIVSDANGCKDTTQRSVKIYGINSMFTTSRSAFCIPDTILFTNTTTADTTITGFQWDFGDGTFGTSTASNPNITHIFTDSSANSFTVKLTVNTALGCSEVLTKLILVSKPSAIFSALTSVTICAGDSVNFQPDSTNHRSYLWDFGDDTSSNTVSPTHIYTSGGNRTVSLSVVDTNGCAAVSSIPSFIDVQNYPQAGFVSSADTALERCYPFLGLFTDTSIASVFASRKWDLGIGKPIKDTIQVGWIYQAPGNYPVTLIVNTTYGCSDTITKTISVEGALADFTVSDSTICKGQVITFSIKDTTRLFTYHWDFGDGYDTVAVSPVSHQYNFQPPSGTTNAQMAFWSADSTCSNTKSKQISIYQVVADFDRNKELTKPDTVHCLGSTDLFTSKSIGADKWIWNFGDGISSTTSGIQSHQFSSAGEYKVSLSITNNQSGCVVTLDKPVIILPLPVTTATGGDTCVGESVQLEASGGTSYSWTPAESLNNNTIPNPIATPSVSTTYSVIVGDSNGCSKTDTAFVYIQQPIPKITWDTTVVIGSNAQMNAFVENNPSYLWTPVEALSCTTCYNPIATPLKDIKYVTTIADRIGCFSVESYFDIYVLQLSSFDVPDTFTPNGDGINDIIYIGGWGIKRLIEFRIYNRWGELVFETADIKQGWDGTYKGLPQNIETYVYQASVETYIDKEPITKKGYINLLR